MSKGNFVDQFIKSVQDSFEGIHAIAVVEISSGMTLGSFTDGSLDPDIASAYNVEVVKSKLKAIKALGISEKIDDILITLTTQYHLINCTESGTHMIYLAADKNKANLAMLRSAVSKGVKEMQSKLS